MSKKPTVYVIYYSTYGHVEKMAREVLKGVQSTGVDAKLFQVAETLPQDVLEKMHAPPKAADVPVITAAQLVEADGFLFGIPTRFGTFPAQFKAFLDSCGQLWSQGALYGRFAGIFFSTSTMGGGQETTAFFTIPPLAHLGVAFVPIGAKNPKVGVVTEVHGGSSYGSGVISGGDGSRQPSPLELELAEWQGTEFGKLIARIKPDSSSKAKATEPAKKEAPAAKPSAPEPKALPPPAASANKPKARTCVLL